MKPKRSDAPPRRPNISKKWYPEKINAGNFGGEFNHQTISFLNSSRCNLPSEASNVEIAEIGCWLGGTSVQFAKFLNGSGTLHLFDYEDKVHAVEAHLVRAGHSNIKSWGSTYKYLDSYNWSLKNLIENSEQRTRFDYVYLDGAHSWAIDALTFFLCDLLLKPGGYIDFDDYDWRMRNSSLDPAKIPETAELYTDEQIDSQQVKLIVDLLVKSNPNYEEILPNKIYRKSSE